jgi:hypothetical protein
MEWQRAFLCQQFWVPNDYRDNEWVLYEHDDRYPRS